MRNKEEKIQRTKTEKFFGAESILPSGDNLLGICSRVNAVGIILLES